MILALLRPGPVAMRWLRAIAAVLPLLLPMAMIRGAGLGQSTGHVDAFAWFPLVIYYVVFTALDYVVGRDTGNDTALPPLLNRWHRALPVAAVPVFAVTLAWAMQVFVTAPFSWVGQLGWALSMGTVSGAMAINVAHELIHKPTKLERVLGGFLLACVGYATFKVEHVHGHHVWVATERDPSSARRGEGVYRFLLRAIPENLANAWLLQSKRLAREGCGFWSLHNELVGWSLLTVLMASGAFIAFGAGGLVFFVAQALGAILHLEVINYIEHYGLARATQADGMPERVTEQHSWNSAYFISNAYLFQLQRHSDHHEHAGRPYHRLEHRDSAPQLPGGYGAMIVLAMIPPLWRAVIDPRLPAVKVAA